MLKIAVPEIKRIEALAQSLKAISLAQGAVRVKGGVHQQIKAYIQELLNSDKLDYYQSVIGIMPLREKIAQKLSHKHATPLTSDNIVISHGSVGAFASIVLALLEAGDEVIIPEPTYPTYKNLVAYAKARAIETSAFVYSQTGEGVLKWTLDIERIKAATTSKTKIIIFPNPVNPLGFCVNKEVLEELKVWCESRAIYLVVDEVYDDYIFEGGFTSITPYILHSKYLIRLGSFSKNFAMSGWRVGYLVAPAHLLSVFMAVQDTLLCCPNVPGQYAALYALDHEFITQEAVATVKRSRDIALKFLEPLRKQGIFSYAIPEAAFCIFLKTSLTDTTDLAMNLLENAGVALVPGKDFGPSGGSFIRLCYAREPELVQEGVSRLQKYFMNDISTGLRASEEISLPEKLALP